MILETSTFSIEEQNNRCVACIQVTFGSTTRHFGRTSKLKTIDEHSQEKSCIDTRCLAWFPFSNSPVDVSDRSYSWGQGVRASAILEVDNPEYSVFGEPFEYNGDIPKTTLLCVVSRLRQTTDGRLSSDSDGTTLDSSSTDSAMLLGSFTDSSRKELWDNTAAAQLNCLLNVTPKIAHLTDSHGTGTFANRLKCTASQTLLLPCRADNVCRFSIHRIIWRRYAKRNITSL